MNKYIHIPSDSTIVSNEYNGLFLLNAHHLHYMRVKKKGNGVPEVGLSEDGVCCKIVFL